MTKPGIELLPVSRLRDIANAAQQMETDYDELFIGWGNNFVAITPAEFRELVRLAIAFAEERD